MEIVLPGVGLITGAASGMGRATASALAVAGCCKLALLDLNPDGLTETKRQLEKLSPVKLEVFCYNCDISDPQSVENTFAKVVQDVGRIDYAVNCAGINSNWKSSDETDPITFERINRVNYMGCWLCSRAEIAIMKNQKLDSEVYFNISEARAQRGAIVHFASTLGVQSSPASASYSGSKAAVMAIARSDAIDTAPHRIRINTVMPGLIDTPMTIPGRDQVQALFIPRVPMKRFGMADEVADTVLFLLSNKASFITGAELKVDGGLATGVALPS